MDTGNDETALRIGKPGQQIAKCSSLRSGADSLQPLILFPADEKIDRQLNGQKSELVDVRVSRFHLRNISSSLKVFIYGWSRK